MDIKLMYVFIKYTLRLKERVLHMDCAIVELNVYLFTLSNGISSVHNVMHFT